MTFARSCLVALAGLAAGLAVTAVQAEVFGLSVNQEHLLGQKLEHGVAVFKGIPYARPPLGELRWQPPQATTPRVGEQPARQFADACMQGPHITDWYQDIAVAFGAAPAVIAAPSISEDCLYLNVWTPALDGGKDAGAKLPVMVWIHGGSNKGGWSYEPNYHGDKLAAQGVVVVSIAYRLGVFGFFTHPQLAQEQAVSANFAVLDQVAALNWVQRNIAQLGGDPNKVTVFGESAGAADIGYLMASPLSAGLFQRAIHQSAGYEMLQRQAVQDIEQAGIRMAEILEAGNNGNTIRQLRSLPAADILAAADTAYAGIYHDPVTDGHLLPEAAVDRFIAKAQLPVDLLIGTNADEWYMYIEADKAQAELNDFLAPYGAGERQQLLNATAQESSPQVALDRLYTAREMLCPSLFMAKQVTAGGNQAWVYNFTKLRSGTGGEALKVYHGAEIPYAFNRHDAWLPTDDSDRKLSAYMLQYWVNFAKTGNPNGAGLPTWPGFSEQKILELGETVGARALPQQALCELFDQLMLDETDSK